MDIKDVKVAVIANEIGHSIEVSENMFRTNGNLKKICGLGFCIVIVIIMAVWDVQGKSSSIYDVAQTGCTCHDTNPNSSVIITVTGFPAEYTPLTTYPVTITVSGGASGTQGGFNLEVSAGTLSTSDTNVNINALQDQATHSNDLSRSWTVSWTAPSAGTGTVNAWIAAMTANDNDKKDAGDLWNLWSDTIPEAIPVNNPPEAQDPTVQGFTDGTTGILHVTDHTPDLGWTFADPDGGDSQQQYDVRVGTGPGLSDMWALGPQSGGGASVVYAGLTLLDNIDYWFGVRVNDGTDWSLWNETQFHMNSLDAQDLTVQGFSDGSPGILHVTDHTPDLAWAFWDGEGDTQSQYEIRAGTGSGLSDMWAPGPQRGSITSEIYAGIPLLDGNDYWFGIRIYDGFEWGPWNETQFHMNSMEARDLTVQGFADGTNGILHITDHTPILGWTFFNLESDSQPQYEIRVGSAPGQSDMWAFGPQSGDAGSELYTGLPLIDGTDYWFGIRVYDDYEWSQWNETQFHLNNLSEARDLTVEGFAEGATGIMHITVSDPELGWTFFDFDGSDAQQQYEVRVGSFPGGSDMWSLPPQIGPVFSVTYTGLPLVDGTDYWFSVRVYDGFEWSLWNETQFHMNTPSEAQTLTVQGYETGSLGIGHITDHTPDMGWTFFDFGSGDSQQQYEIRVGTGSGLSDMWSFGPSSGATVSEVYAGLTLLDGTDYWFGIRVYDGFEWSLWNETLFHMNSLPQAPIPPTSPPDDANIPSSPAQTLSWTVGGADTEGDTITYWWYIDIDDPPALPYLANGNTTGLSSSSFSTSPATDYHWYINATDGWEWNTTIVWNFTTSAIVNNPPEAIELAVSGFYQGATGIMHIIDHTPQLEWMFRDFDGGDTQQQYEIRVGTSAGLSDMWSPGIQVGGDNSVMYAGLVLEDKVDYWFGIRVNDGNTWSNWNDTQFHMNSVEAQGLSVQGHDKGTAGIMHIIDHTPELAWSFWDMEIGDSQEQYEIRVGTQSGFSDMWTFGPQSGTATSEIYVGLVLLDGTDYWYGIRVHDSYEWSQWNETSFHMNTLPPAPIPPLSPFDDANIPSSPAQTLSWTAGGADSEGDTITYWWYIDTDNPPLQPYLANGTATATSSTSFSTSPATEYHWYVNATDGWEWNTSILWNFTTSAIINNPPVAIDLSVLGFSGGTPEIMHILDHTPELMWSFFDPDVGDNQVQYEVRVGTQSGFSDMWAPGSQDGAGNTVTYTGLPLVDGVDYWFGIKVFDGSTWSLWNETLFHMNALPPAPIPPLNPSDDANISDSPAQTLSWTAGGTDSEGDSITYWWYVDTDDPPAFPFIANGTTTGTSSTSFSTAPGTNYYWIINVTDGWEFHSTVVWNFTTSGSVNTPPDAIDLLVSGFAEATSGILHIVDQTPDLSWSFLDLDLGDFQQRYEVRVGTASGLSDMWAPGPQVGGGNTVVYAGAPLIDGTDYWFGVLVYDGIEWSIINETPFHMNSKPTAKYLTVSGFSGGTADILHLINHTPALGWSFSDFDLSDAQIEYEIRVGTFPGSSDMWATGPISGAQSSVMYGGLALLDGTDYWFGIKVFDGYEWNTWNQTQFHMNSPPPAPVAPNDPSNDALIPSNMQQTLSWIEGGSDAEGDTITYHWFIDTENPPTAPYLASNLTTLSLSTAFATSYSTTYFWFVNATDDWEWNWTEIWRFTTQDPPNSLPEARNLNVQGFFEGNPDIIHITDHTPDLGWSFFDSDSSDAQVRYDIRVGTNSGASDMWNPGSFNGTDDKVTYSGSELVDGENYWFGIRVFDGRDWSLWEEIMFHMNALSEVYNLTVNGYAEGTTEISHISTAAPVLGGLYMDSDGGYSKQKYEIRVGSAPGEDDMWLSGPQDGAFKSIMYGGLPLLENTDYWYAVRVFDRYEWSSWEEIIFHMDYPATLDWTGSSNYISDGVNPETGNSSTTFIFKVKYIDLGNITPHSGSPNLHIKNDGNQISGDPFVMSFESGSYATGAIYTFSIILEEGTNYSYYFSALDGDGYHLILTEEKQGPDVIRDVIEIIPPSPPTNVIVTTPNERGKLTISWDAISKEDIAGYNIYRVIDGKNYVKIGTVEATNTSFTDADLDDEKTYDYTITAVDSNGLESEYSQKVQGTTIPEPQDVDGKQETENPFVNTWIILLIIIVITIILILIYLKRRGKYKEEEPLFRGKPQENLEEDVPVSLQDMAFEDEESFQELEEELPPPPDD
ncbi:MAG: hypothetical protein JSV56_09305 [Methanomassiliicoccales archaeon]|nr:MAG: hypothetical protein JSV56_09305 [Methanomassiliicoccales archaeon]